MSRKLAQSTAAAQHRMIFNSLAVMAHQQNKLRTRSLSTPPLRFSNLSTIRRSVSTEAAQQQNRVVFFERPEEYSQGSTIQIYTDASTDINTSRGSGIGIYYGRGHPLNQSQWLPDVHNSGLAEIRASMTGLNELIGWSNYDGENVDLNTDYLAIIQWLQHANSHWRFAPEFRKLREIAVRFPRGVLFRWVPGHTGIEGNEEADSLAKAAMRSHRSGSSSSVVTTSAGSVSMTDGLSTSDTNESSASSFTQSGDTSSSSASSISMTSTENESRSAHRKRRHSRSRRRTNSTTTSGSPRTVFITPGELRPQNNR